jgi:enoyl-CoA hydratase/carnithine racemase
MMELNRGDRGRYVRITLDEVKQVVHLSFDDPERFNSMTPPLLDDMRLAMNFLRDSGHHVRAVLLDGQGKHFCVGANHYHEPGVAKLTSLATTTYQRHEMMRGFIKLREMHVPLFCAVHGFLQGGAMSTCFNCDYRVADMLSTFQHGNLPRGVSPAGGYSTTPFLILGSTIAHSMYLCNEIFSAPQGVACGFLDEMSNGAKATTGRALSLAGTLPGHTLGKLVYQQRLSIAEEWLIEEHHVHCANLHQGGFKHSLNPVAERASAFRAEGSLEWRALHMTPPVTSPFDARSDSLHINLDVDADLDKVLQQLTTATAAVIIKGCISAGCVSLACTENLANTIMRLAQMPNPVVAISHGTNEDNGMLFICHAQHVLAHADATFAFPAPSRCFVAFSARNRLNPEAYERLVLRGNLFDARQARHLGLVNFVGSSEELEEESLRLVSNLHPKKRVPPPTAKEGARGTPSHHRRVTASPSACLTAPLPSPRDR